MTMSVNPMGVGMPRTARRHSDSSQQLQKIFAWFGRAAGNRDYEQCCLRLSYTRVADDIHPSKYSKYAASMSPPNIHPTRALVVSWPLLVEKPGTDESLSGWPAIEFLFGRNTSCRTVRSSRESQGGRDSRQCPIYGIDSEHDPHGVGSGWKI